MISHSRSLEKAMRWADYRRDLGHPIILTNGCFDLLHPGHVRSINCAARHPGKLIVAVNSDYAVRCLKGDERPIQPEGDRLFMVENLASVDHAFIFEGPRLDKEILAIRPTVYVKSGNYSLETLDPAERLALEKVGAKITFEPYIKGYSTTELIARIVEMNS